jgi:hypothetical protein
LSAGSGVRISTFELEYPLFIHAEFLTHRIFSRNTASNRAMPSNSVIQALKTHYATPCYWGTNKPGMQSGEELKGARLFLARTVWNMHRYISMFTSGLLFKIGLHKQHTNRITGTHQIVKVLCTSTDYSNFIELRDHPDAQPEINVLARCMKECLDKSTPKLLKVGHWHIPYVYSEVDDSGDQVFYSNSERISLNEALNVSVSCAAQISYRNFDLSLNKAQKISDRLQRSDPVHASPFEHQARSENHVDFISNNFKGWLQHRSLIPNNNKTYPKNTL